MKQGIRPPIVENKLPTVSGFTKLPLLSLSKA
jgi:hypothetical protein